MIRELGVLFLIGAALVGCCKRAQQQRMPSDDVTAKIQGFVDGVLAVGNWEHLPANVAELHLESTRSNYFSRRSLVVK